MALHARVIRNWTGPKSCAGNLGYKARRGPDILTQALSISFKTWSCEKLVLGMCEAKDCDELVREELQVRLS